MKTRLLATVAMFGPARAAAAQPRENLPVDLPDGPAQPGFDIDRFSNAVFIDSRSATPTAFFVDAQWARVEAGEVRLDSGEAIRAGVLCGIDGERLEAELPQQIFTRWHGYVLTFPGAEVFGQ